MKIICILCALEIEYRNVLRFLSVECQFQLNGQWEAAWCQGNRWLVVCCGVGTQCAEQCANSVVDRYSDVSGIISAGMAGAMSPEIAIGDLVIGSDVLNYQLGVSPEEIKCNIPFPIQTPDIFCFRGKILCSSDFLNNKALKNKLYEAYKPLCVEMESAGVLRVCSQKSIPFAGIKVISDYADGGALKSILRRQFLVTEKLGQILSKCIVKTS